MSNKKYYWLKLKENFFDQKVIKYLRKLPDGNTLTIIYLKLLCASLKTEGVIPFDNLFPSIEEEIAMILDEDITLVKFTLTALVQANMIEELEEDALFFPAMMEMTGQETDSAQRVRRHRAKEKTLQCNTDETTCNGESNKVKQKCSTEIEKEIEIEKDIEKEVENKIEVEESETILAFFQKHCPSFDLVPSPTQIHQKTILESFEKGITLKEYETAFQKAEQSSFLKGENKGNWKAKFGWMIQADNLRKILSGNYDEPKVEVKSKNSFHGFHQREYDYEELERKLLEKSAGIDGGDSPVITVPDGTY